jgi:hypothetical protein
MSNLYFSSEAPREGTVLSLLKAEWKMSDTGSSHWASSLDVQSETVHEIIGQKYVNHQAKDCLLILLEKSTNQKQDLPKAAMLVNGSWRNYRP